MEREIKIDVVRCIKALFSRWYLILICMVACVGVTYIATADMANSYTAQATVYSAAYGSYKQSLEGVDLMQTYSEIINSRKVADRAAVLLGQHDMTGEAIAGMIAVSYTNTSAVMYINAYSVNPDEAVDIANAVAESFVIEAQSITGDKNIQILDEAQFAQMDGMSRQKKYSIIVGLIAFLIPVCVILLREILSDRVYHIEDAELNGELDIIGIIPLESEM
ncbi:MAG: Wzz/FepE/Etk N-terminal domain-containing protein [Lachnospiraceae bacterium]|nr:Wzz/FepE/Etk N-terminal domain-containing protein [Lachnospiraceae bacterium]